MEVPDIQVIRHWVAWGPTANCPDSFIEHDAERIELFETWLADVKAQAWDEGQIALLEYMGVPLYPAKGDEQRNPKQPRNPYRQGEEQ